MTKFKAQVLCFPYLKNNYDFFNFKKKINNLKNNFGYK